MLKLEFVYVVLKCDGKGRCCNEFFSNKKIWILFNCLVNLNIKQNVTFCEIGYEFGDFRKIFNNIFESSIKYR